MKTRKSLSLFFVAFFLTLVLSTTMVRAETGITLPMTATQNRAILLDETTQSDSFTVRVDPAEKMWLIFLSNDSTLDISLMTPNGLVVSKENVESVGGIYLQYTADGSQGLINPLLLAASGTKHVYTVPNPLAGEWTVNIARTNLQGNVGVFFTFFVKSEVVANIVTNKNEFSVGETVVIAAVVNCGDDPFVGASAVSVVVSPSSQTNIVLLDNGFGYDVQADDGIHTGSLAASVVGKHMIDAEITGTNLGELFTRHVGAVYTVNEKFAKFDGVFSDSGVDNDNDGLVDGVRMEAGVNVFKPGQYDFKVTLRSSDGIEASSHQVQELLSLGAGSVIVEIGAEELRRLSISGPYLVSRALIEYLSEDKAKLADEAIDAWETNAYSIDEFERPDIYLTGNCSDYVTDSNGNSLYDLLTVQLEVDLVKSGSYQWSARLADLNSTEIDFAGNSGFLNAGVSMIELSFDGCEIGENGVNGPFIVTGFLMCGAGKSLISNNVASTQDHTSTGFECAVSNNAPIADAGDYDPVEVDTDCMGTLTLDGSGSSDPDGDPLTYHWTWDGGSAEGVNPTVQLPLGTTTITLVVNDGTDDSQPDEMNITVEDTTPPATQIILPISNQALQDGVILTADASDACGVAEVYFYVGEADDGSGSPIGYEGIQGVYNGSSWKCDFDTNTPLTPDGYYVILTKAVDPNGNEGWSAPVPISIRNWAVIELLPNTANNKAGRTMPVKFALRIAEVVDPAQPFVYNQELEIKVYDASGAILQTSVYGDTSTDYRIDTVGELYITNFKTSKTPAEYVVEIWRISKNFLIGSFAFETVK